MQGLLRRPLCNDDSEPKRELMSHEARIEKCLAGRMLNAARKSSRLIGQPSARHMHCMQLESLKGLLDSPPQDVCAILEGKALLLCLMQVNV